MALRSMTGFARVDDALGPVRWHWELRTVNGRGLDLRFRLPPGFDALEPKLRDAVAKRIVRGSLNLTLIVERDQSAVEIRLNEEALDQVARIAHRVAALTGSGPPSTDALLQIRGVLETIETVDDEETAARRSEAILVSLDRAVAALVAAREAEGGRLAHVICKQIDQISEIVQRVENLPCRRTEAVTERLRDSVARLIEANSSFDPARLHQEAVLLATRADVEEELKRLAAHVAAARELLAGREPVGRKFDFLAQEFNREANTLCSKSNDAELTRLGLDLKTIIDQMREQIQNIE